MQISKSNEMIYLSGLMLCDRVSMLSTRFMIISVYVLISSIKFIPFTYIVQRTSPITIRVLLIINFVDSRSCAFVQSRFIWWMSPDSLSILNWNVRWSSLEKKKVLSNVSACVICLLAISGQMSIIPSWFHFRECVHCYVQLTNWTF